MKIKNFELKQLLLDINSSREINGTIENMGWLNENLSIACKRILQKIFGQGLLKYQEYAEKEKEIESSFLTLLLGKSEPEIKEAMELKEKELKELSEQEVELTIDKKINMDLLDSVVTQHNYNFDLIERFS